MAVTALQLINDALNDLEIKSSEVDLTANEIATGIRYLNRLMASFAASGIVIPFKKVTVQTDDTNIPDYIEDLVVTHLAIRMAPSFGVAIINPALIAAAQEAITIATRATLQNIQPSLPSTLPRGTGNTNNGNSKYFEQGDNELFTDISQGLDDETGINLTE